MSSSHVPKSRNQTSIAPAGKLRTPQRANMATHKSRVGETPRHPIDLTGDSSSNPSRKRKPGESSNSSTAIPKRIKTQTAVPAPEKRLRRFRPKPPSKFYNVYARALSQRFFVLGRTRSGSEECPEEVVEMTGSTGNIYTVVIAQIPSCDCPHALKGNQCKHLFYVLKQVLNAPYEMIYQAAFLSSELRDIFAAAPPISTSKQAESDKRKPVEGDCPICFSELEAKGSESVVWCRAACGQNMHEECFNIWARTKQGSATCPMCRSVWKDGDDAVQKVRKEEGHSEEGYVNVGAQLGLSNLRDESSYHRSGWRNGFSSWEERYASYHS
ncbi:hypothetical protein EDB81DRAFT_393233 [Dactylonectria macrodidyma]|uniref:Znf1 n=1 Tax=Dactylonectria macrodidyma TaxID=307937 RepID=A0A9P9FAN0_9HYPO|nr:hypothetical protein EDB81DRAFT_393233 [Dactylonectria macrodidyma]